MKKVLNDSEVIEFYSNHSLQQTATNFSVHKDRIIDVLVNNNIELHSKEDDKSFAVLARKKTNLERHGSTTFNNPNKAKQTLLERYGNENYHNIDKMKQTKLDKYGDPTFTNINKAKQTKLDKYGDSNYVNANKAKETKLEKYGNENYVNSEKAKQTKLEKYGDENYNNIDKAKHTRLEKYGSESYVNIEKCKQTKLEKYGYSTFNMNKTRETKLERYGDANYTNVEKSRATRIERYGTFNSSESMSKLAATNLERYGVPYYCMTEDCRKYSNDSVPNKNFAELLDKANIKYEREFRLGTYSYDFKVGNKLIEINPTFTHNSTIGLFGEPKDKMYHKNKSKYAEENGYQCIHVWDWDNINEIINLLSDRDILYARKCKIKEVDKTEAKDFINTYHIQGYAKDDIRIGLYYNNELVSIMTFGKPRYNKNYQYELVRYCASYNITGGAEKLFNYFIKNYNPKTIISYCDRSKFNGNTYIKLGFKLKNEPDPSRHWYNLKTNKHITDNLLRQRGFDQLFNEHYGKGTSNNELMIQHGFLEVYDCGQATYVFSV